MATSTVTMDKASTPSRPGNLGKILYILVVLIVAFVLYKGLYQPDKNLWWIACTGCLLLGFLPFILLFLDRDYRRPSLFLLLNVALAIVISAFIQRRLVGDARIVRTIRFCVASS